MRVCTSLLTIQKHFLMTCNILRENILIAYDYEFRISFTVYLKRHSICIVLASDICFTLQDAHS